MVDINYAVFVFFHIKTIKLKSGREEGWKRRRFIYSIEEHCDSTRLAHSGVSRRLV